MSEPIEPIEPIESIELRTLRENIGNRDRVLQKLEMRLEKRLEKIFALETLLRSRDATIDKGNDMISERDKKIVGVTEDLAGAEREIAKLEGRLATWKAEREK